MAFREPEPRPLPPWDPNQTLEQKAEAIYSGRLKRAVRRTLAARGTLFRPETSIEIGTSLARMARNAVRREQAERQQQQKEEAA